MSKQSVDGGQAIDAESSVALGSDVSGAWSSTTTNNVLASNFGLAQRVSYNVMSSAPVPKWVSIACNTLELAQYLLVGIGAILFVAFGDPTASCHENMWKWPALLSRVPRDPTPSGEQARLYFAVGITVWWLVVIAAFMFEFIHLKRGLIPHHRVLTFLRWVAAIARPAVMPSLAVLFANAL
jgi:hypothetical protein